MSDPVGKAFRGDAAVSKTAEPGSSPGTDANLLPHQAQALKVLQSKTRRGRVSSHWTASELELPAPLLKTLVSRGVATRYHDGRVYKYQAKEGVRD